MGKIGKIYKKVKRNLKPLYYYPIVVWGIKRLAKQYSENHILLIAPVAIGDFCYGLAYLNEFSKKKEKEGNIISIIAYEKRKSMLDCYGLDYDIIYIQENTFLSLVVDWTLYHRFLMHYARKYNIYSTIAYYEVPESGVVRSCLDITRNDIFCLDDTAKIIFPTVPSIKVTSIDDFDKCFNRVIILNPYSNSLELEDKTVFERIALMLSGDGYILYTNVIPGQTIVKGTKPLDCSIFELYNICLHIPLVVSIRSGIIDFLISTPTNFFIIYDKDVSDKYKNIYNLSAWGTNNVKEIIFRNRKDTISQLIEYMNHLNLHDEDCL